MKLAEEIKELETKICAEMKAAQVEEIEEVKKILNRDEIKKLVVEKMKVGLFDYELSFRIELDGTITIKLSDNRVETVKSRFSTQPRLSPLFNTIQWTIIDILKGHGFHVSCWPSFVGKGGTMSCEISFDCKQEKGGKKK